MLLPVVFCFCDYAPSLKKKTKKTGIDIEIKKKYKLIVNFTLFFKIY